MSFNWAPLISRMIHDERALLRNAATKTQLVDRQWTETDPRLRALLGDAMTAHAELDALLSRISALRDAVTLQSSDRLPLKLALRAALLAKREHMTTVGGDVSLNGPSQALSGEQVPAVLQNVLEELLENSMRFRDNERALRIEIETGEDDGRIKIVYADNGRGWDPQLKDKLFEPFERLDVKGGFGLGLTIVKALLDASGGSIEASTTPAGSTFTIYTLVR